MAHILSEFVPLSKLMAEQITGLRGWAKGRARLATTGEMEKSVFNCLKGLRDWKCDGWVYQPNARDVNLEINWPQLLEICRSLRPLPSLQP